MSVVVRGWQHLWSRWSLGLILSVSMISGCALVDGTEEASEQPRAEKDSRSSTLPSVPPDFTTTSIGHVRIGYPGRWTTVANPAGGWALSVRGPGIGQSIQGKPSTHSRHHTQSPASVQLSVLTDMPRTDDPIATANTALAFARLAQTFRRTAERPVDIPGATGAYRIDYTYRTGNNKGGVTARRIRGTDITIVDNTGKAVLVRITRDRGKLGRQTLRDIITSLAATSS